jgi:signal transduction histidine kinase
MKVRHTRSRNRPKQTRLKSAMRRTQAGGGSGARGHALFNQGPTRFFIKDRSGHYLEVSRQFQKRFGLTRAEAIRKTALEVFPPEYAESIRGLIELLMIQVAVAVERSHGYDDAQREVKELQAKALELEHVNRVKDEFLSVMSHELRTPINVIMGYTALFKEGVLGEANPAQENALQKVSSEAAALLAIVNNILFATSFTANEFAVDDQEFSIAALIEELGEKFSSDDSTKLSLIWDYPEDLPPLRSDRRKVKHILENLLNNALKFTPHGQVCVSVRLVCSSRTSRWAGQSGAENSSREHKKNRGKIDFTISDTGIGISRDSLPNIFEKFYQADSSQTRDHGGVGLGLYIAKKYCELLGATINVESELGKGSTFTVRLPI